MSAETGEAEGRRVARRRAGWWDWRGAELTVLLLGLTAPCTVDPVLGDVHRVAERGPYLARRIAGGERIGGSDTELVQNHIAHEGATEVLAKLGRDREREFGMLHTFSVAGQPLETTPERRNQSRA